MLPPLEGTLLEKLRKIEALHAGTKIDGEREAARRAKLVRSSSIGGSQKGTVLVTGVLLADPAKHHLLAA